MAVVLLDDFNRANGALGSNWTRANGMGTGDTAVVNTNQARNSNVGGATCANYWNANTYTGDVEVSVIARQPGDTNGGQGVFLQYLPGDQKGYFIFWQGSFHLWRLDPGFVDLIDPAVSIVADDVIGARIVGDTVYCLKNGVVVSSVVDTTYRRANFNIGMYIGAWNNHLDNFSGGSVDSPLVGTIGPRVETMRSRGVSW